VQTLRLWPGSHSALSVPGCDSVTSLCLGLHLVPMDYWRASEPLCVPSSITGTTKKVLPRAGRGHRYSPATSLLLSVLSVPLKHIVKTYYVPSASLDSGTQQGAAYWFLSAWSTGSRGDRKHGWLTPQPTEMGLWWKSPDVCPDLLS
jgi:hypothetical protein